VHDYRVPFYAESNASVWDLKFTYLIGITKMVVASIFCDKLGMEFLVLSSWDETSCLLHSISNNAKSKSIFTFKIRLIRLNYRHKCHSNNITYIQHLKKRIYENITVKETSIVNGRRVKTRINNMTIIITWAWEFNSTKENTCEFSLKIKCLVCSSCQLWKTMGKKRSRSKEACTAWKWLQNMSLLLQNRNGPKPLNMM